jgi:hypothetical protein
MRPPQTSQERKDHPIFLGCIRYFPFSLSKVALLSKLGNEKHNPGQPMHHARGKSADHADCIARHLSEVGTIDPDTGLDHAVSLAWRALALLQELGESKYGAELAPGAKCESVPEPFIPVKGAVYNAPPGTCELLLMWDYRRDTPRFADCDCTVIWTSGPISGSVTGYDSRKLTKC